MSQTPGQSNVTNDTDVALKLITIEKQFSVFYSYTLPWIGLVSELFALSVLFLPTPVCSCCCCCNKNNNNNYNNRNAARNSRREHKKSIMLYIFKWQYSMGTIYILNIIFINTQFTTVLFGYDLTVWVPDVVCKLQNFFDRFFYCVSAWMQVVILTSYHHYLAL